MPAAKLHEQTALIAADAAGFRGVPMHNFWQRKAGCRLARRTLERESRLRHPKNERSPVQPYNKNKKAEFESSQNRTQRGPRQFSQSNIIC
jgi:hypothetical protein